jgi:hypothetical protein
LSTWETIAELNKNDGNDKYATDEGIVDAFWQTLATGNVSERNKWELRQMYEICKRNWILKILGLSFVLAFWIVFVSPSISPTSKEQHAAILTQLRYLLFRRMIRTEQRRYLGLASGDIRRGDEVWLLEGSKVPLIIRRQTQGYGRLIGDAYIHGIMYGEAFKVEDCEDLILE